MAEGGRKASEFAKRSERHAAPWCSKWLHAKLFRAALDDAVVDFLSHLSHLSRPVQHLPVPQQYQKGHQGQMCPLLYLNVSSE